MKFIHRRLLGSWLQGVIDGLACILDGIIGILSLGHYVGAFSYEHTLWLRRRIHEIERLKLHSIYMEVRSERLTGYNTAGEKIVNKPNRLC